jgi:hypothetical protein
MSTSQIVAAITAGVLFILLLIPATRHWLQTVLMQFNGWLDARLLRSHHEDLVVRAVSKRISGIMLATQSVFARWLRRCRAWFAWLGTAYNKALAVLEDARRKLAEEEQKALSVGQDAQHEMPQFLPLGPVPYYLMQFVLGCGEAVLTYLAFQLWHLSPAGLLVIVALFGFVGAALGHFCGQAIYRRKVGHAIAIGCIGLLYCSLLGSMRFAWLAGHSETGGVSLYNFLGAFGWPLVCLAVSVLTGSQLRYLTALEQAQADELRVAERCDRLNQRGIAAAKALRDQMNALQAYKTTLIDAYHRGFSFGWKANPIVFPDQSITVPDSEIDGLWPPVRPLARTPSPIAQRLPALGNGAVVLPAGQRKGGD